ncbi:pantetheine-phosphate adenylyltransferase [Bacillus daqingensis]|uniref:Phosphopantetheine adenylyltransferase n=1 Tax=Bacillus daqingensis TaxID=872396 RepID=A0ABV9NVB5_9BACI
MTTAIIPGSFDPVTNGHVDIMQRSTQMFDRVITAVMHNSSKKPLFSLEEKLELLRISTEGIDNLEIKTFDGLLAEFARKEGATVLVKGLRSVTDYEYEIPMAVMNREINTELETIFLPTSPQYRVLSSSIIKEVARFEAVPNGFVPPAVAEALKQKLSER